MTISRVACGFVLLGRRGLNLAPELDRAPALLDEAADEVLDEGELGLDEREPEFAFDDEQRRKFLADERCRQLLRAGDGGEILLCEFGELPFHLPDLAAELQRAVAQQPHY